MRTRIALIAAACVLHAASAQAALYDRGGGLIYDDVLDVTWLADANYAKTMGYDADGLMTWSQATAWAANLNYYDSVRHVTYTDWRLPTTDPINGVSYNYGLSINGTTDYGVNMSAPGTAYAGSTGSEMAYMFYQALGNPGYYTPSGTLTGCSTSVANSCLHNAGPFVNIQTDQYYWSNTASALDPTKAWYFGMGDGWQGVTPASSSTYNLPAWAVRPGDVAAVPEADTWAMLLAGLGLVGMAAKRRRT